MSTYIVKVRTATCTNTYFAIALSSLHAWSDAFDRHADLAASIVVRARKGAAK
jgi:hypothetical protein